jgi:hypothetical protein
MTPANSLHRWLALLTWTVLAAVGCTSSVTPATDGTSAVRSMALVCVLADGSHSVLSDPACTDSRLFALVGGGSKGTLALATIAGKRWYDQDKSVPGYTPLTLAGPPAALAVSVATKQALALIPSAEVLQVIDLANLTKARLAVTATLPLDFAASDLVLTTEATPRVILSDPQGQRLASAPLSSMVAGGTVPWQFHAVAGSPGDLAWLEGAQQLWVGHLRHGYVSVVGGQDLAPVASPLSLVSRCRNGLDDDGDGQTDRLDNGCDHGDDDSEWAAETGATCSNGLDDDEDGQTDASDPGCSGLNAAPDVADGCRNGVDDDGDGKTDFPADLGCSGWADGSESSDTLAGKDAAPPCANGVDEDADGLTDLDDADCYNRTSAGEVTPDTSPGTLLTTSLDGKHVVVVDRAARVAQVANVAALDWLRPQTTGTVPWLRPSRLDAALGVRGVALTALPLSLGAMLHEGRQAVAIGQGGGGVVILRLEATAATEAKTGAAPEPAKPATPGIHLLSTVDLSTDPTAVVSSAGRPELRLGTTLVDLATSIPARFAALGVDRNTGSGIVLTETSADHRTEIWRLTYEAEIPGSERSSGSWLSDQILQDPTADFCQLGVLTGDWLHLQQPACGGNPAQSVRYRIAAVSAERLTLESGSGAVDVPATEGNQLAYKLADRTPVGQPNLACWTAGSVAYHIRGGDWVVTGSRSGLLSRRPSQHGQCRDDLAPFRLAARAQEPKQKVVAGVPQVPASCPMLEAALDPALEPSPLQHPVFGVQLRPGCAQVADGSGKLVTQLLPTIREAQWAFVVAARLQPITYNLGSAPVALHSAAPQTRLYGLDQGSGGLLGVSIEGRNLTLSLE